MTLVPRFCIRLAVALGFLALVGLPAFNQNIFAQTAGSKPDPNRRFYTIVRAPDGGTICRTATAAEAEAQLKRSANGQQLHQINHLVNKSGPSTEVNDGSLPGLKIFLFGTPQLEAFPAAKAAFIRAAGEWEKVIKTPMTVYLEVDYGPTGFGEPWDDPNVIGATGTLSIPRDYTSVRTNLIVSASNNAETALYNLLPSGSVPTNSGNAGTVALNVSLARALGFIDANADITIYRQQIAFNSAFKFDTDSSDGVTSGQMDFEAVATHEIGHALGFDSSNGEGGTPPRMSVWDLFRFRPGVTDFTNTQRIMTIGGGLQVYYAGGTELGLATGGPDPGPTDGDGDQSSHWRDNNSSNFGTAIGIMDPNIALGTHEFIKANDISALNFMGYNMEANTPPPPPPPPPSAPANDNFASAQVISGCTGSVNGTNIGATKQAGEPSHSPDGNPGGASVWYQWQSPSTGSVTVTTAGSNYDTLLAVYTGNSVNALTLLGRNDDASTTPHVLTSSVTFNATAGTTYRIAVDGYDNGSGGDSGNIILNWTAQNCTVTPTCTYTINPTSQGFTPAAAAGSTVSVTTGSTCAWTATSNSSFITITGGASGTGNGTVTYSVAANTTTSGRAGTMTIAGQTFTVNQAATPTGPPTVQLAQNSYSVNEGVGSIAILVNRAGDLSSAVSVNYTTSDASNFLQNCNTNNGKATSRCDYISLVGTLHFAAGENSKTLFLPIVDDTYLELPETLFISLFNPSSGLAIGTNQQATITLVDNGNDGIGLSNPIDGTTFFVRQHYMDFLGREPDPSAAGWVSQINNCVPSQPSCDRLSVSQGIYGSPEFKDRGYFIYKFYSVALGRKPSYDEFVLDRARVSGFQSDAELEQSKQDFIADFMNRPGFTNAYNGLTNDQYVQTLFNVAGVTQVTVTGFGLETVAGMQQLLNGGQRTRAQVLRDIAESPEVSARFLVESTIVMHYFGYLRRDPDASYQDWINIYNQTGDSRNVTNGFVNSQEYRNRFGQ